MTAYPTRTLCSVCLAVALAAGCGGSSPKAPTSPDRPVADGPAAAPAPAPEPAPAPSPSGAATISGTVSAGASTSASVATLGLGGVTVSVSSAAISTVTDSAGRFRLEHVPGGTVRLDLSGGGVRGELELHDVGDNDSIEIEIEASAGGARVVHDSRDDETGPDAEAHGVASDFSGSCPDRNFRIGSQAVTTTASTTYQRGTCASLTGSPDVEVHGTRRPDGTILATSVNFDDDAGDGGGVGDDNGGNDNGSNDDGTGQPQVEFTGSLSGLAGTCPAVSFSAAGRHVTTGASTDFRTPCSGLSNGRTVEVRGTVTAAGEVAANRIKVD